MDVQIISAIIGAVAVIIAAIIGVFAVVSKTKKQKIQIQPIQFKLFVLGTNIAKIGWGKAMPSPAINNIEIITLSTINELGMPDSIKNSFNDFISKTYTIKELTIKLPEIKNLFGTYFLTKYGKNYVEYYYLGFNLINICPMLELASMQIDEVGPIVKDLLNDIIKIAEKLKLPIKKLNGIMKDIKKGIISKNPAIFDQSREDIIMIGEEYINILRNKSSNGR